MLVGMDAIFRQIRIALFGSQIQTDCICPASLASTSVIVAAPLETHSSSLNPLLQSTTVPVWVSVHSCLAKTGNQWMWNHEIN